MEIIEQIIDVEPEKYTLDEIGALVRDKIEAADLDDSTVAKDRQEAYKRYYAEAYGNEREGRSQHKTRTIFEAVEQTKALLLETFTASHHPVTFLATTEQDETQAQQATAYAWHTIMRFNNGYKLMRETFHDALLCKSAALKVYWKPDQSRERNQFTNVPPDQFQAMQQAEQQGQIEILSAHPQMIEQPIQDQMGQVIGVQQIPLFSGEFDVITDTSYTAVDVVPPEQFYVEKSATDLDDATFVGCKMQVTRSDLVAMDFDRDVVDALNEHDEDWRDLSLSSRERNYFKGDDDERAKERQKLWLHEAYIALDQDDDGVSEWYQIYCVGNEVLSMELVEEHPFILWNCMAVSHSLYGQSLADVLGENQRAQTNMTRAVIDHAMITTNPMSRADLELIRNPEVLLDNIIGGVVDSHDPSAVNAIGHEPLDGSTLAVLEMLRQESDATGGSSRLANGLNPAALSNQNASDMISAMSDASNRRTMQIARSFAEEVLAPLLIKIVEFGRQHDFQTHLIASQGQAQQITPQELAPRKDIDIAPALTPMEKKATAMSLMSIDMAYAQSPDPLVYGSTQRYNLMSKVLKSLGIRNADPYQLDPQSPEGQQMQQQAQEQAAQQQQMQQQMAQMQLQMQQQQIQIQEMLTKAQTDNIYATMERDRQKVELELVEQAEKQELEERKQAHSEYIDDHELRLEERKITEGKNVSGVSVG